MVIDEASQPAAKPLPPPPSYSESVAADSSTRTVPHSAAQYHYGPTPINAETGAMLHSYDVAQAVKQADRRALRRFVGALLVALVVYALVGIVLGGVAEDLLPVFSARASRPLCRPRARPPGQSLLAFPSASPSVAPALPNLHQPPVFVRPPSHLSLASAGCSLAPETRRAPHALPAAAHLPSLDPVAAAAAVAAAAPRPAASPPLSPAQPADEDLINRSLLDSIDSSVDPGQPPRDNDLVLPAKLNPPHARPDSPPMHYIHSAVSPLADSFPAKKQPSLFTALQPLAHDGAEPDPIKPVMNGYNAAPYRTSTAFNAFTNNSRARQQPQPPASAGPFRDPFSQPYPTAADVFGPAPLPGQQPQHLAHPDAISPSRMYEYDQALTTLPSAKSHFGGIVQESRFGPSSSLLQSQQVQISKSQQQQHAAPAQASQQGPYLPAPNSNYSMPNGITAPPPQPQFPAHQPPAQANGQNLQPAGQNASGEEISTIFVVGFPEDMQEREFQNMFTFCSGFEAATLKIPNKDSNAYGTNNNAPQGPAARPNGFGPSGYPPPQIGYAGDGFGTEQGVVAWPPSGHDEHFGRPQEPQQAIQAPTVPPRKQIIGFAKFKTRAEALEARDVLQGKRIDIEKGAVLKAEMAKKNLHTKRGVGPLGIPMALVGTGATVAPDTLAGLGAINGLPAGIGASEALTQRERELGAIGAMGLAGVASRSRDRPDDVEEKLRRATLAGPVVAVAFVRRDQDDKERRQRESDAAKMRGYDAFYSVPAQHRPTGGSIAQPAENSGMSGYPFPASASGTAAVQPFSSHDLFAPAGTAGTWGHGATKTDRFGTSRAVGTIGPPRPPSDPQSSPPPAETSTSSASTIGSATITAADAMSPKPLSPTQASSQLPPLMLPMASRAYSPTSGEAVAGGDVRSMPASSGSSVTGSQGSENGEMGRSVTSGGTPNDAMSPQQPASPVSGGSSVTTNANMRPNVTDQNPPINTLYVGNLPTSPPPGYPPNQLEESLRILFQRCPGFRKLCFRQKSNGPMCFVEFDDVQFASRAMQDLYGDTLNGLVKNGIRLSYSKNPLGVRTQPTGPTPNARQEPPHTGPIGIQEAFNGRHLQSPTSLTMPIEIGHSRPRAEEVPGMYNNFAASPPSRFFPSPPPGPHARPAFSPLMAQQTQYARPSTQHVYAPAPVSGFNFGPGALSPASPPPVWMPPSAPNDSIDDRYMSPGDFGTHAMSPSPGLEVSRAA